jgi:hypothetical protein
MIATAKDAPWVVERCLDSLRARAISSGHRCFDLRMPLGKRPFGDQVANHPEGSPGTASRLGGLGLGSYPSPPDGAAGGDLLFSSQGSRAVFAREPHRAHGRFAFACTGGLWSAFNRPSRLGVLLAARMARATIFPGGR